MARGVWLRLTKGGARDIYVLPQKGGGKDNRLLLNDLDVCSQPHDTAMGRSQGGCPWMGRRSVAFFRFSIYRGLVCS